MEKQVETLPRVNSTTLVFDALKGYFRWTLWCNAIISAHYALFMLYNANDVTLQNSVVQRYVIKSFITLLLPVISEMKLLFIIFKLLELALPIVGSAHLTRVRTKMAQGICTSILPKLEPDLLYAVGRSCLPESSLSCNEVCRKIGKNCYNAIHIYSAGILNQMYKEGTKNTETYKYETCTSQGCGPNFCCCADKKHTLPVSYKDAIAQAACHAMLPKSPDNVYAVRRHCSPKSKVDCNVVCYKLKKKCFESIHVYDNKNLEVEETGKVGLRTYRYNTCQRASCGPNFCCCAGE
ncbi:uncharacterized protein LOC132740376 [Ruditapes philippinarum]|uniref:uncharacterized protein LOC132740376 n=1 Tax=Ruditapes philippinarum TaxID=129788 RepID=UPI00295BFB5D|nr:uncharacterized protein LOC132740376 [Ruditapes philippinarum]